MHARRAVLPTALLALATALAAPSAEADRWEIRREVREGIREVEREKREARREIMRCETRSCARREIREGYREVERERREARREIRREIREHRHDGRDRDGDLLRGVVVGAAVVGVTAAIVSSSRDDD
jgi:hypothetical protein